MDNNYYPSGMPACAEAVGRSSDFGFWVDKDKRPKAGTCMAQVWKLEKDQHTDLEFLETSQRGNGYGMFPGSANTWISVEGSFYCCKQMRLFRASTLLLV